MTLSVDQPKVASACWSDYEHLRDDPTIEKVQLFFDGKNLWVENMGWEGILHSEARELLSAVIMMWLIRHSDRPAKILGSCAVEKPGKKAAAPDLLIYLGDDLPKHKPGEKRQINLDQEPAPNLVIEVADTTLASDLDLKKHLYAELGIPEYWVIDVVASRIFLFSLGGDGIYQEVQKSAILNSLSGQLIEQTLEQLNQGSNVSAAAWFNQQLSTQISNGQEKK